MTSIESNFNIAELRDEAANNISEMGVYRSVVENVVGMDADLDDKISILISAVPDLGIIMAQLSLCKSRGLIDLPKYNQIVSSCLLELHKRGQDIKFDPKYMRKIGGE